VQDFFNIRNYEYASIYSEKTGVSYMDIYQQSLKCYRENSIEPVKIREIFGEKAEVGKILEQAVAAKLEADQQLMVDAGHQRTMEVAAQAAGAENKILGFCMNTESLFAEYLGDPALPSYVIELKYADLGYDNLNIFD
jgi:hypothetical protein